MPQQQVTWRLVLRLVGVVTGVAGVVVLGGGSALWWVERSRPDATIRTWPDALWFALTTMTTVGYGDHVPVTAVGRLVAAAIMVLGVAVIGAVAAVVALAVARRAAIEEERDLEAEADRLEHRLEVRLARIEEQLLAMERRRDAGSPPPDDGSGLSDAGG